MRQYFARFAPFWLFLVLFKFGGGLHYELLSPLGALVMPIWIVGMLIGISSLIQMILDVPAGHLLDKFGYRRLLMVTTFIFFLAGLVLMFEFTQTVYIVASALATFGWVFFGPGINAYILSHSPAHYSGRFISLRDIFGSVGIVLASGILGIVYLQGPQTAGLIIAVSMALALVAIYLSPKDSVLAHAEEKIHFQKHYIRRHFFYGVIRTIRKLNPASSMLLLLGFSAGFFYSIVWFVVPLVIAHAIVGEWMSIGLGVFDLAIVLLGFTLGKLADTGDKKLLVFCGLLLFAAAGLFLGMNFNWLFLILGFVATTGDEMASVSLWSWLHALDSEHANDGAVSGIINLFQDLGWALGPITAGITYGILGPSYTIGIGAAALVLTWLVYLYMVRGHALHVSTVGLHKPRRRPHRV